jgi:hypothetical protein
MGTHCEEKKVLPSPQRKRMGPPLAILRLSHLLHAILISKTICHYFSLGLMERWGIWMCIHREGSTKDRYNPLPIT